MKLLSCEIENFGILSQKRVDFQEGVNVFLEENGKGKTTLCAFIRAMFYGLPSARGEAFNARTHYYPFSGGKFGGALTLERDGDVYRIERFFDKKSERKDECKVYRNDRLTEIENVGQYLFGLNEDSFSRTISFRAEDTDGSTDEEILLKLNRTVQNTDGEALERAKFLLAKAKKVYRADRGNNDEITHTKEALAKYDELLAESEKKKEELLQIRDRYRELESSIPVLEATETDLQRKKVESERYVYYKSICEELEEAQKKKAELYYRYPQGLPTEEEIKQIAVIEREEIFYRAKEEENHFAREDEWRKLDERYGKNEPTEEVLASVKEGRDELMVLERRLQAYVDGRYEKKPNGVRSIPYLILAILSVIAVAVGIALWQFDYPYAEVLTIGGGACLLLTGIVYLIRSVYVATVNRNKLRETRADLLKRSDEIRRSLSEFFDEYGLQGEVKDLPDVMAGELVAYHALSAEKADKERRQKEFSDRKKENADKLFFIRQKYRLNDENYDTLSEWKAKDNSLNDTLRILGEKEEKYRVEPVSYSEEEENKLKDLLKESRREYTLMKTKIEQSEHVAEDVERYRSERALAKEHLAEIEKKAYLLQKTIELLTRAGEDLHNRYISPVKQTFRNYAGQVEKASAVSLSLDDKFSLSFEKNGEKRTEKYLSTGERAVALLCLRLALLDGLYEKETPFLVLDDPFAWLDENSLGKVQTVLRELGKTRQILYFTCHGSRSFSA